MDGSQPPSADRLRFGTFEVDLRAGELWKGGRRVALQEQPFRILARLLQRPGDVVTREELRRELWPDDTFVDFDHGLNAAVKRLRDALGDSAETPRFVETVPRRGYRFLAPAEQHPSATVAVAPNAEAPSGGARRWAWLFGVGAAAVLAGLAGTRWTAQPEPSASFVPKRLNLALPPRVELPVFGMVAISRAGDRVCYLGVAADGSSRVYVRAIDREDATPVTGTEGAGLPLILSPDEQWIGYFAGDSLVRVPIGGGSPVRVADVRSIGGSREIRGASWGPDGTILIGTARSGLFRLRPDGSDPELVTRPDVDVRQTAHRWPSILPGGRFALFSTFPDGPREDDRDIGILDLESGTWRVLHPRGQHPRYAASGHIVYAREGSLFAVPFDPARGEVRGHAVAVLHDVQMDARGAGAAYFDISQSGTLVYVPGAPNVRARRLVWVDRRGASEPVAPERRAYASPRLSPDGRRIAVTVFHNSGSGDIWTLDLRTSTWNAVTSDGDAYFAVWSPDGSRLAFGSDREGPVNIYWTPADGSGPAERLTRSTNWHWPLTFPDSDRLFFSDDTRERGLDIGVLHLATGDTSQPFLATPRHETGAVASPNGRWIAHTSSEPDRVGVYVRDASQPQRRWAVPGGHGVQPVWARDGRELFFRQGTRMFAVEVADTGDELRMGEPRLLFDAPFVTGRGLLADYDVAADGRFLMLEESAEARTVLQLVYVPDWFEELKHRLAVTRR